MYKFTDDNVKRLTKEMFSNLSKNIERPDRLSTSKNKTTRRYIKWYNEVIEWCDSNSVWFMLADEYFDVHPDKVRKALKKRCRNKIIKVKKE